MRSRAKKELVACVAIHLPVTCYLYLLVAVVSVSALNLKDVSVKAWGFE
jgi:hypothetical protein